VLGAPLPIDERAGRKSLIPQGRTSGFSRCMGCGQELPAARGS